MTLTICYPRLSEPVTVASSEVLAASERVCGTRSTCVAWKSHAVGGPPATTDLSMSMAATTWQWLVLPSFMTNSSFAPNWLNLLRSR